MKTDQEPAIIDLQEEAKKIRLEELEEITKNVKSSCTKQVVLEHLLDNEPAFSIEYTKHGNPKPDSFDKADAIVIAKAGWSIESNQDDA